MKHIPASRPPRPWQPGNNPLTRERPFAPREIDPLEAAVYTACLGPALCLGPDPVAWLVVLVVLPLDCLLLGSLPWPARFSLPRGLWPSLLVLGLLPLQAAALAWLLALVGLRAEFPQLELSLLLTVHAGAFLYLQQVAGRVEEDRRRASVRAAFLLPLPLMALWVLGALERLVGALPAGLPGLDGLPRLGGLVILLGLFQLARRRLRPTGEERA
jgi:hypothetical protein